MPTRSQGKRVLITTVPFGDYDDSPIELLKKNKVDYTINPLGRRPTENETIELIKDFGILLAGTSPVTRKVIDAAPYLRLIARAGIGLDNIDLLAAKEKGIQVTYTPHAPAPAVAEFVVGCMLALLRHIPQANQDLHKGVWKRQVGRRLADCTVGLMGVGSIGKLVVKYLQGFGTRVLGFDLRQSDISADERNFQWVDKEKLLRESDIISLHLPLTQATRYFITCKELGMMKPEALLVNTSRGGIICEEDLFEALQSCKIAGAALDVFEKEPYDGPLAQLDNCLLTSHMAAASVDCKRAMEMGAVQEVLNFLTGKPLRMTVPQEAYKEQERRNGHV
ncbi:MAG: hypothetical protein A3D87_03535 [Omnitrophica WOR_2 bacterium RIFCSPHIGHO2_02_FULL_50_17]|nr:MAG: hypothetical protein A3D87_03535 [Omnitrophica WOR_2 bacterium RIFCSPHIGHO2_02_FULL_50_17]